MSSEDEDRLQKKNQMQQHHLDRADNLLLDDAPNHGVCPFDKSLGVREASGLIWRDFWWEVGMPLEGSKAVNSMT